MTMKLLLTSAGLTNRKIIGSLERLVNRPLGECNLAFVPTAANVETGDKRWLIEDLVNCQRTGFKSVDIVDISAIQKEMWLDRLEKADVLLFGGGNTYHLMYWLQKSGADKELEWLLHSRIYVGISAGSMVATKNLMLSTSANLYSETGGEVVGDWGLGLVDFQIRPHLNSPHFPKITVPHLEEKAKETSDVIYALDDQSAILVNGNDMEVVSEGAWKRFN
jgi:dipeptidase E